MNREIRKVSIVVILVFTILSTVAANTIIKEEREISDINRLDFNTPGLLILIQGDTESLIIEGDKDVIENIETKIESRTLIIKSKDWTLWDKFGKESRIKFILTIKEINEINLSGSGDIQSSDIKTENLELNINGSGDVDIETASATFIFLNIRGSGDVTIENITVDELEGNISGSGEIEVGGKAGIQRIAISGSGDYQSAKLETNKTLVKISGSGDSIVQAIEDLDVKISGSGDVDYYESPKVTQKITGSGDLRSRE
ncbi:MAG: head GIN domain-containing protein [Candidatus Electryonea clarkiae]|nr:head GIN domain-containing protein [Candidatus Electryonea clarkiae]MDP8285166.1 head GIN domain-containing protein [Candidatus Electryonea clarkiae]